MEEDNIDRVRRRWGVRKQKKARNHEKEMQGRRIKRKRSSVRECVRKRDGGNIYLSPDGSVLGVHLWRNEISG